MLNYNSKKCALMHIKVWEDLPERERERFGIHNRLLIQELSFLF